jgi:hypothetical protein
MRRLIFVGADFRVHPWPIRIACIRAGAGTCACPHRSLARAAYWIWDQTCHVNELLMKNRVARFSLGIGGGRSRAVPSVAEETSEEKPLVGSSNITCYKANRYQRKSHKRCGIR